MTCNHHGKKKKPQRNPEMTEMMNEGKEEARPK